MSTSLGILLLIITIIFVIPSLCRFIHIPSIVGFIFAGMAIGPYGFHWVTETNTIATIGQLGMFYIMFQSGSEIDLDDFRTNKYKCIYFGILSFIFPLIIGYYVGYYTLTLSKPSSLLLGAMLGSHTLMTYPIVSRYGIQDLKVVNILVGGTMLTIFLALLCLSGIEIYQEGGGFRAGGIQLILMCLVIGTIMFVFPWLVQQVIKRSTTVITHFLLVLFLLILSAQLAEWAHLEGIFGAFICGVALNRMIPNRSALMNRINFMGNSLFVPIFLLGVGMLIDVRVFYESWTVVLLALIFVGCKLSGKWLASWLTQKTFAFSAVERRLIFGLSQATAAGTIAIASVGYRIGFFSSEVLSSSIIVVLILCTIAAFLTEYASKRLALRAEATLAITHEKEPPWLLMTIGEKRYDTLNEIAMLSTLSDTEILSMDNWDVALDKVENTNKSIIIYHEVQPINTIDRMIVVVPQYAEKEREFITCFGQLRRLCGQIGAKVTFYCWSETERILRILCNRKDKVWHAQFQPLTDWTEVKTTLPNTLREDDMVVILSARKSTASYNPLFTSMTPLFQGVLQKYSYILMYPEQSIGGKVMDTFLTETAPTSSSWTFVGRIKEILNRLWKR